MLQTWNFILIWWDPPKEFLAARAISVEERERSSTWRELAAIKETWTDRARLERFRGWKLVHYTDNKATAAIVAKGSRQPHLPGAYKRHHHDDEGV